MARHALEEEQPGLLVEDGVWRSAGVAGHVLLDVAAEDVLNVLLLEAALDDELVVSVDGAHGAQLGEEEGQQVLRLPMQPAGKNKKRFDTVHKRCNCCIIVPPIVQ